MKTKKCTQCEEVKELGEFSKRGKGYRSQCKECISEYHKKYQKENKEKIKEYREKNKEKYNEQRKEYREENKEKISEYKKEYRKEHKDMLSEYQKKYRKENKNTWDFKARELLTSMKTRSKKKGYSPPECTKEEIKQIIIGKCCITGIKFDFSENKHYRNNLNAPSPE